MSRRFLLVLVLLLFPSLGAVPASIESHCLAKEDAEAWMAKARAAQSSAHAAPERIEIVARYFYDGEENAILDRTIIEPGERLHQKRDIEDARLEREWTSEGAYLLGPAGRVPMTEAMRRELRDYFCLRQLAFLVFCEDYEAAGATPAVDGRTRVAVEARGEVVAELEIDRESGRLLAISHVQKALPGEDGDVEHLDDVLMRSEFADFRQVDGWSVPFRVSNTVDGAPSSVYEVVSIVIESP